MCFGTLFLEHLSRSQLVLHCATSFWCLALVCKDKLVTSSDTEFNSILKSRNFHFFHPRNFLL